MNTTQAQLKALDDALVAPADRLEFGKCNMRRKTDIKPKEATFQVMLDALALTSFYQAFLITSEVPAIYIDLGHSRDIIHLSDVSVDYLHQPWRAFSTIINKCLSGKETGMDKIRLEIITRHEDTPRIEKPVQATKGTRLKTKAKVAKSDKKKQPVKMPKSKGLDVLSKVALTEAEQLKIATKRSKTQFHNSHTSGSGDGIDTQSKEYESEKESWGDSGEEDENDENIFEDKSDGNDDDDDANDDDNQGDDTNDYDKETDSDSTESDRIKILVLNQSNTEYYEEEEKTDDEETMDEEEDDEVTKELYDDVNMNLGNEDTDMTNKADEPIQSSSVSFDFTSKLLNLENPSPDDNEIASLMETSAHHAMAVPKITSGFTKTIPPPPSFFNPLPQQATPTPTPITSEPTTSFPSLPDLSSVFRFNNRVTNLEKDMSEINQVDQQEAQDEKNAYIELFDTSMRVIIKEEVNNQLPQILPQAVLDFPNPVAASLSKFELTKILLDKMEESKSHLRADYKKKLYDALVESYNTDKYLFNTYGEVFMLKRSRDDSDKDRDPSAGSDRGTKRRKSSKEAESSRDSRSATDQEFDMGNNDEQPADKEVTKDDCQVAHAKEPRTSFNELMDTSFDFSAFFLNRLNIKDLTQEILVGPAFELLKGTCKSLTELEYHLEECSKATTERLDWHNPEGKPCPFDLSKPLSLIRDHQGHQVIPQDFFINNDLEYLKGGYFSRRKRIIAVTRSSIMKKYDYGHLEEIEVRREDQKLYKFREGDFPQLRLQDIEDMLLLRVQKKLANLIIEERYALNVALCMYTRRINIQRSNLINRTTYTAYSDPKGVIYKDQMNRNRLMLADELHKFSDGMLDDVRSALNDIDKGIRMEYLLKRKWSGLDKRRAWVMIQDIDKQLYERRLMRNLEKFVGGREYENDLRLLERII
ncbi:hypothetical protein Tco_0894477 [Tanacetum coccineum]|uniref:Uncharacterized protein n=1 Tax=Tanacetum coccineum TaxID=301880 RepID=A0ABQ5CBX3_9ASTR